MFYRILTLSAVRGFMKKCQKHGLKIKKKKKNSSL